MDIIRIPIKNYIHVRDTTTNLSRLIEGPQNYALQSNEIIEMKVTSFVQLKNNSYIRIKNPVLKNENGEVLFEEDFQQIKLDYGEEEIRTYNDYKDPFPLYPGEIALSGVESFLILGSNEEVKLQSTRFFYDKLKNKERKPGDVWMVRGPISLVPRKEVIVVSLIKATVISNNSAIRLKALRDTYDINNVFRKAGEEWLIREAGAYLPNVDEEIVNSKVKAYTLTDKVALYLRATRNYKDIYGIERKAGDEWLITNDHKDLHILDVNEELVKEVEIQVLSSRQYCVILNPIIEGKVRYGEKILKRGETSFFLQPGESLENNKIYDVLVLDENNSLLLMAIKPYEDKETKLKYNPGEKFIVRGPREFVIPLELKLIKERKAYPLNEHEGIYIRNISTGEINVVTGQTYLLSANEVLWEKELNPEVETLINAQFSGASYAMTEVNEKGELVYGNQKKNNKTSVALREKFKVVTFRAPQNSAVQVFDYKTLQTRVIFGLELVKLGPHEEFTISNLSGKKPKEENQIKSISVLLGPDFMTDIIEVETRDHARLLLQLCYSWKFDVDKIKETKEESMKVFKVNDFIGDACKNLAARIRGTVSTVPFEVFHKNSASIVKSAVFGQGGSGYLRFESNNLLILNVDIQSQEPIDIGTRENLSKSTNLSIHSQTLMQQLDTEQRQKIITEENKGKLDLQIVEDNTLSEKQNIEYLIKKIETEVVKTTGELKAKANAVSKSNEIKGNAILIEAKLNIEAREIEEMWLLSQEEDKIKEEMKKKEELSKIEIDNLKRISQIEVDEFTNTINAIGNETLIAMAKAGPEAQSKMLHALGIKSFLITDGKNPINLFNTVKKCIEK